VDIGKEEVNALDLIVERMDSIVVWFSLAKEWYSNPLGREATTTQRAYTRVTGWLSHY